MATQQDVIKAFMRSLDEVPLRGADALDAAVRDCSNGRFANMQDLIDSFIRDIEKNSGEYTNSPETDAFLRNYCGIILDNADTGSITGSDANGLAEKTADSIVAEPATITASFPSGARSTINGLTIIWPDRSKLSPDEAAIADRLYSWWIGGALDLIQESFGMNFQEANTSTKEITVKFYNNENNALASTGHFPDYYTGKSSQFTLNINMFYYTGFNQQDKNGASNSDSASHLDRTLAHEFVHAVMAANIDFVDKLPLFVKEGLAELVHGIDDARTKAIQELATTQAVSSLKKLFSIRGPLYNYGQHSYAGGYMLFRYLAKQAATEQTSTNRLPSGVIYNGNKTKVSLLAPFSGTWDSADYAATVKTIDATEETNSITIHAGNNNNTILTGKSNSTVYGQGGNDIIHCGQGTHTLWYGTGDGADTVYGFKSGKDMLQFYNQAQLNSVTTAGTDITLHSGSGSVNLIGKANQRIDIIDTANRHAVYYFGRQDKANTFVYSANQRYYGSIKYTDSLQVNTGGTVSLANTTLYHDIDTLDATRSKAAVRLTGGTKAATLYGSSQNDTLTAGSGSTSLIGGKGNDQLLGGNNKDVFWYGTGDGADTIRGFQSGKDVLRFNNKAQLNSVVTAGTNVVLRSGNGSVTLAGKTNQRIDIIDTANRSAIYYFGRQDKTNTFVYAANQRYYGSAKFKDTLQVNTGAAVSLANTTLYHDIDTLDATRSKAAVRLTGGTKTATLYGSSQNDTLTAGSGSTSLIGGKGNDQLYGGNNKDVFWYGTGDGADTIRGFQSGKDVLRFNNKAQLNSVVTAGTNVVLRSGNGSVTLTGKTNQRIDIIDTANRNAIYYFGRQDKTNTFVYAANQRYYGSAKFKDTLQVNVGGTVSLANTTLYHNIDTLDATRAKTAVKLIGGAKSSTLYGSSRNDTLMAGNGSSTLIGGNGNDILIGGNGTDILRGGAGNDTIKCGKGMDKMQFYKGNGRDTIQSAAKNDILYLYNISNIKTQARFSMSGKNLVMSFTNNSNDRITLTNWSRTGMNNFVVGGRTYHLKRINGKLSV